MLTRIAKKEFTEMLRDGRFRWSAAAVLGLLTLSLIIGLIHYADISAQHEAARAAERERWLDQGQKNPHSAAHYGVYAFKPKNVLSVLDAGLDPYVGVTVWLEAHYQNDFLYRPAQDATAVQRFGEMTAAAVMQLLLPLLIILLTFGAFAGEREQGTLRQLLSLGVDRRVLALGKAIGVTSGLAVILIPAVILGAAAVMLYAGGAEGLEGFVRYVLLVVVYVLYLGVIVGVALTVSAAVPPEGGSRVALVVLLSFWIANSLIAPRLASDLSRVIHPLPSSIEFKTAMKKDLDDQTELQALIEAKKQELFRRYGVDSLQALPVNLSGFALQAGEEHGYRVYDRHYGRLFDLFERQMTVYQVCGLVAPLLPVQSLSMGLAGTDWHHHRHFVRAGEDYRRVIQKIMNDDIFQRGKTESGQYLAGPELWQKVPDFVYEGPTVGWVLKEYVLSIFILTVWCGIAFAGVILAIRKMHIV
jgi:ABC-2 type transport system permease protein